MSYTSIEIDGVEYYVENDNEKSIVLKKQDGELLDIRLGSEPILPGTYIKTRDGGGEQVVIIVDAGSSATLDLSDGNVFEVTNPVSGGVCTLTLVGATNGLECGCSVRFHQGPSGDSILVFSGDIIPMNGGDLPGPVQLANAVSSYSLSTPDGGATIYAWKTGDSAIVNVTFPAPPIIGTAISGETEATVTWSAPVFDGGSIITGYQIKTYLASDDSIINTDIVGLVLTDTIIGLNNGDAVYFKVAAINEVGIGYLSSASNTIIPGIDISEPSDLSGLVADYEADSLNSQADLSSVAVLSNAFGSFPGVEQSNSTIQPTLKKAVSAFGGHSVIRGNGSQYLRSDAYSAFSPMTLWVVGAVSDLGDSRSFFDGLSIFEFDLQIDTTPSWVAVGSGGSAIIGSSADTNPHIHCLVFDGVSSVWHVDGGSGTTGDLGLGGVTGVTLMATGAPSAPMVGDGARWLIYNHAQSKSHRNVLGSLLATKYGLTWTPVP